MKNMKILCVTPVKHISGLYEKMVSYGDVIYKPEIREDELIEYLKTHKDVDCLFVNPNKQDYKLNQKILAGSSVKIINTASTGLNHIDLKFCEQVGIKVLSLTKDLDLIKQLPSTAELSFGLMLSLLRLIPQSFDSVKAGEWNYEKFMGHQTRGLIAGIIGFGRLGILMAKYCKAFDTRVLIYDPYKKEVPKEYERVNSLVELAKQCDVISLHVHVTDETRYMINEEFLQSIKRGAFLINTSRGEIVDELAVIESLNKGQLGGYGTDVIADEYGKRNDSPVIKAAQDGKFNIVVTPHIGGMTWEGQKLAYSYAINKFKNLLIY